MAERRLLFLTKFYTSNSLNNITKVLYRLSYILLSNLSRTSDKNKYWPITFIYSRYVLAIFTIIANSGIAIASPPLNQLPVGGNITAGSATIINTGSSLNINQITNRAVINWSEFNIGTAASVNFIQPNISSITLNRINSNDASQIYGNLSSNGQIYLINTNGIYFGLGANVNVGGIVATTQKMSDENFMKGSASFHNSHASGTLINDGTISTELGGYIALLAPEVQNNGVLIAKQGTIVLAGIDQSVTLNFPSSTTLSGLTVKTVLLDELIHNHYAVALPNGLLALSTRAVDLLKGSVLNSGIIDASGVTSNGGRIILQASSTNNVDGNITANAAHASSGNGGNISILVNAENPNGKAIVNANISALGGTQGGNGGSIETSASKVQIGVDTNIDTYAPRGMSGNWTIDPTNFTVSSKGGDITGTTVSNILANTNITLFSTQGTTGIMGDININDLITWSSNSSLTLNAQNNININSSITASGNSAKLILQYGQSALNLGNTSNYFANAPINIQSGNNFSTQLGSNGLPINYTVINSLGEVNSVSGTDLQGINGGLNFNYALGSNITAATFNWNNGAGFMPIGAMATPFTGNFDGLGHTISNLNINQPGIANIGLFGVTSSTSTIQNIGLIGGTTIGGAGTGGLIGNNGSNTVNNSYNTGNVAGGAGTGGLVGSSTTGNITNSYATGSVNGAAGSGGLEGSVTSGSISNSYATGNVSGAAGTGGLVGSSTSGNVTTSYASGSVIGAAGTGGLVGSITSGTISSSYAVGSVVGAAGTGGLVGATSGAIISSYWNNVTGPATSVGGGIGLTTSEMQQIANFSGWEFNNTWFLYPGLTYPLLRAFLTPLTVTVVSPTFIYGSNSFINQLSVEYSTFPSNNLLGSIEYSGSGATAKNVGTYPVVASGLFSNQAGYIINYIDGNIKINQAPLSIIGTNSLTTYSSSTQFNTYNLIGLKGSDTVTGLSGISSGINYSTTPYQDSLSAATGTGLSNYKITYTNGSLSIGQASLLVTGANTSLVYNGLPQSNSPATYSGQKGLDAFKISGYASGTNYSALRYNDNLTASGSALDNYKITYINGSLGITQAPLIVSGDTTYKTYNATTQTNAVTSAGLENGDSLTGINGLASGANYSTTAYPDNLSAASGPGISNYAITYINGSLTIGQAPLAITGSTTITTYNANLQKNTFLSVGLKANDLISGITGLATGTNYSSTSYVDNLSSATGTAISNYSITYTNGRLTIGQAPLTITGSNTLTTYSATTQRNTFNSVGLKTGDSISGLSGVANGTDSTSAPYLDNLSSATGPGLSNYSIVYINGSMTIGQAPLNIIGANTFTTYNSTVQKNTFSSVGLKTGDSISGLTGVAIGTDSSNRPYLDYLSAATGQGLSNYAITYTNGNLTIGLANLVVTGANTTILYSGKTQFNSAASYSGQMGNDIFNITGYASGTKYNINGYADNLQVSGVAINNYKITYLNGSLIINQAPLTVVGDNRVATYNALSQNNTFTTLGLKAGDTVSSVNGLATGTNSNISPYLDSLSVATGTGLINYSITYTNGSLKINNAPLTIVGASTVATYNAGIQTNTYSTIGLKIGDSVTGVTGLASAINYSTVPYADALSNATGKGISNYEITFNNGSLSIGQAPLSLSVNNATKSQNTSNPIFTTSVIGFLGTDNLLNSTNNEFNYFTSANINSPPGNYAVSVTGLISNHNNYSMISNNNGVLTVIDPLASKPIYIQTDMEKRIPRILLIKDCLLSLENEMEIKQTSTTCATRKAKISTNNASNFQKIK